MIFEKGKTYDHVYCMRQLHFCDVESFQKWAKKHNLCHFRCNGTWFFDGDELVEFFRSSAKRPDDWRKNKKEERLELEGADYDE